MLNDHGTGIPDDHGQQGSVNHYHVTIGPSGQYQVRNNWNQQTEFETHDQHLAAAIKTEKEKTW
jgi:hypothetical protein